MMRFVLLFLFVIGNMVGNAQVRLKLNYNKRWQLTTADSAVYIRVCIYDTTNSFFAGPVADLYLSGKPQMSGMYKYGRKAGDFTSYYENGQIESKGMFENDLRTGVWRYFYSDGKLKQEIEFFSNGNQPKVMTSNDEDGDSLIKNGTGDWEEVVESIDGQKITITGQYQNYEKDGKWTQEGLSGDLQVHQWYKKGKLTKQEVKASAIPPGYDYSFPLPWKFIETEAFDATSAVTFKTYPELILMLQFGRVVRRSGKVSIADLNTEDNKKVYMVVERQPEVIGGLAAMSKFVSKNIQYPREARRLKISGSVFTEFIVEKDGTISGPKVIKGIGGGCDEEAIRVIKLMNKLLPWRPGMQNGKPVRVRFVLPVKFMLGK